MPGTSPVRLSAILHREDADQSVAVARAALQGHFQISPGMAELNPRGGNTVSSPNTSFSGEHVMARDVFLSEDEAAKIHDATLRLLAETGIALDHEEAEDLLLSAGARKDQEGRILLPGELVSEALEKARPAIQMCDREGNESINLQIDSTYFGPGSDAKFNIDRQTRRPRDSTLSDVRDNTRLVDALPGFDFVMSMGLPHDIREAVMYPTVYAEVVRNCTKPVVVTSTSLDELRQTHHIASIVAGGDEALRAKPRFLLYLEPNSPLIIDRSVADRLLYCAEHEIPFAFPAGANCGVAAPVTLAGAVVQGSAESLAGLVIALLKNEHARFVYGSNSSAADMKNGKVLYGAPEWFKTVAMYADMGRYYNLPTWGTAGCTDALHIDAQAGMEVYEGIIKALQSGVTIAHDVGFLAYGSLYDIRLLVLANDMILRAKYVTEKVDLSEESLALEVIDDMARGQSSYGSFLAHSHTAMHFRESLWLPPDYFSRALVQENRDAPELEELLEDCVSSILAGHSPAELDPQKRNRIDEYLNSI